MGTKAKISGSVVAGFPSPAEQYLEPPLDLNELLVKRPAATYFVRVEGDSMSGAGISDGDLLVVDRSLRPADGDVIIASVDGDFTVKTYRRDADGIRLEPASAQGKSSTTSARSRPASIGSSARKGNSHKRRRIW